MTDEDYKKDPRPSVGQSPSVDQDPTSLLPPFLRKLADDIDSGDLSNLQLQSVGEFYMSYLLASASQVEALAGDTEDVTDSDFWKFISLGFYVYRILLKDKIN